ncbi:MAG: hypothetical protein ABJA98_16595 [Acidobacteriota bacterium]
MTPYDEREVIAFTDDAVAAFEAAGVQPNRSAAIWLGRMQFDAVTMGYASARAKHLAALKAALGNTAPTHTIRPTTVTANLVVRGAFFALETGERWTAVQCSDFALLARYLGGEDILPTLDQRASSGFNLLRVWTLFDIPQIGTLTALDYDRIPAFVGLCADHGLYVEFTAYTGINDPQHWSRLCQAALACRPRPLLELVNELDVNTNEPDAQGRVFNLALHKQAPAPLLSSHGSNGSQAVGVRPWWSYEEFHTNDASEWHRKTGHNAMELSEGTDSLAASRVPVLSNENTRFPDRCQSPQIAFDAAAGAALLCAGSAFHSVAGKLSVLWGDTELECARAWANGAKSVPLEFQIGKYVHPANLEGADDLRVYQRVLADGRAHTVRIRK